MARLTLAPIVADAAGKLAGVVFSRWKGRNYARKLVTPANPQTADQTTVREALARCVLLWRSLEAQIKTQLDTFATGIRMSGYNWFVGQNRVDEETYVSSHLTPHNPDVLLVEDVAAASGGAGAITVTWTDPGVDAADYIYIAYRKVETGSEADTIELGDKDTTLVSAETFSLSGLDTGEEYRVFVCAENADDGFGENGSATADAG